MDLKSHPFWVLEEILTVASWKRGSCFFRMYVKGIPRILPVLNWCWGHMAQCVLFSWNSFVFILTSLKKKINSIPVTKRCMWHMAHFLPHPWEDSNSVQWKLTDKCLNSSRYKCVQKNIRTVIRANNTDWQSLIQVFYGKGMHLSSNSNSSHSWARIQSKQVGQRTSSALIRKRPRDLSAYGF
jgi:hypothetical protein